jgi:hypothetical protein
MVTQIGQSARESFTIFAGTLAWLLLNAERVQGDNHDAPNVVCAIDSAPADPAQPQHSQSISGHGLAWLGSSKHILGIVQGSQLRLMSLEPCMRHVMDPGSSQPHPGYTAAGRLSAGAQILAVAARPQLDAILISTAESGMACYCLPAAPTAAGAATPSALRPQMAPEWSHKLSTPHALLTLDPGPERVAASAAHSQAAIAIWRVPSTSPSSQDGAASAQASVATAAPDLEWLRLPCPLRTLQFRPSTGARPDAQRPWAATLMAACADGCVRLWVDTVLADTLPASLASGSHVGGAGLGRSMCLAHVLTLPGTQIDCSTALLATWSLAGSNGHGPQSHTAQHVSWLVATSMSVDSEAAQGPFDSRVPDELYVWAVTVDAVERHGQEGDAVAADSPTEQTQVDQSAGVLGHRAWCRGPRISATLWGCDHGQVCSNFT